MENMSGNHKNQNNKLLKKNSKMLIILLVQIN